ncbi:hypothetical protein PoB_001195900 [Plakobranchus ocellatus]|uniref:Uncharacterized protein n=1 Tax=Plakobranchus ocellatus TaxID=259542 RepID=A0AAV3YQW1_9GAST|nr:hypothetical protein PoB_001195900 [Plakobranchus ocellatus]
MQVHSQNMDAQCRKTQQKTTLEEAETYIKAAVRIRWTMQHPPFRAHDQYPHTLNREEKTIIFRLKMGHNRLRKLMHTKFKIGETPICHCGQGPQSAEHDYLTGVSKLSLPKKFVRAHHPHRKSI